MTEELEGVAIVGMAGRFPGARDVEQFWSNLVDGVESITTFDDAALLAAGVPREQLADSRYVKRWGAIEDADCFDAAFFGITRRDAELMDPQQRLLLQCAWETLESAGHITSRRAQRIGAFAGAGFNQYLLRHISPELDRLTPAAYYRVFFGNDKDFLCTRIAHALNLTGPAMTVQTACSTSLVAVCQAALQLLTHQCDLALAGGVSVRVPAAGYLYEEGGTGSADGSCRAFDASANGAVWGSGVAMVALKRLEDAVRDRDHIYAVIKGFAVNNDGSDKAGFSAPSVDGQAQVIGTGLAMAGFDARTIGYVEAHGTATALGDPIEVAALTQAFRENIAQQEPGDLPDRGDCALGSVKTNIGHLDTASGVTGLIKAALCVKHRTLPASLHFKQPNPHIDFASGPFRVNAALTEWPERAYPRRAGVSSFGIGGTNAHVVLEEFVPEPSTPATTSVLLPLSAKSPAALERAARDLASWLERHPEANLGDVAYTLQAGREALEHRRAVICRDAREAMAALRAPAAPPSGDARLAGLARTWLDGRSVDWTALHEGQLRSRLPLPTYSFEREQYLIERPRPAASPSSAQTYGLRWMRAEPRNAALKESVLVVGGEEAGRLAATLERSGARAIQGGRVEAKPAPIIIRLWTCHHASAPGAGLEELQRLLKEERPGRVLWITERAQAVESGECPEPTLAALWGLGRSFIQERSPVQLSLLDVDDFATVEARHLGAPSQLALRGGQLLAPELAAVPVTAPALLPPHEGAVLITGGLGGLGLRLAEHLVRRHAVRRLVLVSRQPPSEAQRDAIAALEGTGAAVTVVQADVADRATLARVVQAQPLRGIVHAAGVLDDGVVARLTGERLERVMAPKVLGGRWLDELTQDLPLDFFVLFSSVSSLGAPGQASYAAANAGMEAIAQLRRARGLPATAIVWGPWAEVGMAARTAGGKRSPLRPLPLAEGLALFDACLASTEPVVYVAGPELLERARQTSPPTPSSTPPRTERPPDLRGFIRSEIARLLSLPSPEAVPLDRRYSELGLDSLMEIELRSSLSTRLGQPIPGGLLVDHPTVETLSAALADVTTAQAPEAARIEPSRALQRLHPESPNPPLFLVGGAVGGNELYLRDLAVALGPLQPCYALLYPGTTRGEEPLTDVGALADYFLAELRRFQVSGPIALGGHSLGGLIAFEMALKLSRAGRTPLELFLLDAPLFSDTIAELPPDSPWREPTLRGYVSRLRSMNWLAPEIEKAFSTSTPESWSLLERSWTANVKAMQSYRATGTYHGEATFLTPARDAEGLAASVPAWRRACPNLKVARVNGNHLTMVRAPQVERAAHVIRGLLGHSA